MLRRYNSTPEEALENPELMELVLSVFRADLALCESYVYAPEPPFSFPITAFGGLDDQGVTRDCIEGLARAYDWSIHGANVSWRSFFP